MSNLTLTIDAGNTRIKWGLFDDGGHLLEQGACTHKELPLLQLPTAAHVIISNVAGNAIESELKKRLLSHPKVTWLTSQAETCGVTNGYENPAQLGTDRWAAIIAAAHLYNSADLISCIVVNAGTAVTIDVVTFSAKPNEKPNVSALNINELNVSIVNVNKLNVNLQAHFAGGVILPGLNLMQESLLQNTANLDQKSKLVVSEDSAQLIANNTKDAIYLGALNAICGAIYNIAHLYKTPRIILSGGNANIIQSALTGDVTKHAVIVDNLVLQGLYLQSVSEFGFN